MSRPFVIARIAAALLVIDAAAASAQSSLPKTPGFELLIPSGTSIPTGVQESDVERGNLTAVQVSYGIRPDLVMTGTVGWTRTRPVASDEGKLDILTYDVGTEFRMPRRSADRAINVKPFAGLGAGARTYNYRRAGAASSHGLAAYVSAGAEIGLRFVRLRLEARDYVTALGQPRGWEATRRNDVAIMAGLRLALR